MTCQRWPFFSFPSVFCQSNVFLFRLLNLSTCRCRFFGVFGLQEFLVVFGLRICRFSQSVPRFYSYDIMILGRGCCGLDSSLVHRKIHTFALLVFFSILLRIFCMCYFVHRLLFDFFSRFEISLLVLVFFLFFLSFVFCYFCSNTFGTSMSFSLSSLSRNFLSVIDVIRFQKSFLVLNSRR